MFFINTIRRWWRNRRRNIFHYYDSFQWRRCDPVEIGNRLEEVCADYQKLLDTIAENPADSPPGAIRQSILDQQKSAAKELADVAMKVFDLLPLSEKGTGGVTRAEAINVLARYFVFMEKLAGEAELFHNSLNVESPSHSA